MPKLQDIFRQMLAAVINFLLVRDNIPDGEDYLDLPQQYLVRSEKTYLDIFKNTEGCKLEVLNSQVMVYKEYDYHFFLYMLIRISEPTEPTEQK